MSAPSPRLFAACAIIVTAAIAPKASAQPYISGIDVSRWQGTVDWQAVRAEGIEFAFARATRGESFNDPLFLANMRGAAEAGVLMGAYHFCRLDTNFGSMTTADAIADATAEANHFVRVIKPYYDAGMMLPPVADVEGFPAGITKAYNSAWVQQFSDSIFGELGVRPLIYTNVSQANSLYTPAVASSHDLWLAQWTDDPNVDPGGPSVSTGFRPWLFWQWTDGGEGYRVDGVPAIGTLQQVDGDAFRGSRAELEAQLSGNGSLGGLPQGRIVITDFDGAEFDNSEADGIEGYFLNSPYFSGTTTGNIDELTTATRVTSHAHQGTGSQRLFVAQDPNAANWTVRNVAGIGQTPALANPAGNLPLDSVGSVGFWLNTTKAGVTVQLLIDDPVGGNTALETSTLKNVVADGQWHLYEWDFDNANLWNSFAGGDGTITGTRVTIDSIVFKGSGDSTIFLDSVAHNPNGSLVPIAGDFNGDYLVDGKDLEAWRTAFGVDAKGDADNDGDSDGVDFLAWQRNQTAVSAAVVAAAVPEPASLSLLCFVAAVGWRLRRRAG